MLIAGELTIKFQFLFLAWVRQTYHHQSPNICLYSPL